MAPPMPAPPPPTPAPGSTGRPDPSTPAVLTLARSELLGLAAVLPHEIAGLRLGALTPSRLLNARSGRQWSAQQWWALLKPCYEAIVAPPPRP